MLSDYHLNTWFKRFQRIMYILEHSCDGYTIFFINLV